MKYKKLLVLSFLIAVGVFLRGGNVFAATRTWDGGGSDTNFSTAANWTSDTGPASGDTIVFPVSAAPTSSSNTINVDEDLTLAGITFTGDSGSSCSSTYKYYDLAGSSTLTLTGDINSSGAIGNCWGGIYLDSNLTLGASIAISQGTAYLALGSYGTTKTVALGSHSITYTTSDVGSTIDSILTGSGALNSEGGLFLSGNNTGYSGTITVVAGGISVSSAHALGTAALTVGDGVNFYLEGVTMTVPNIISLVGASVDGYTKIAGGGANGGCPDGPTITLTGAVSIDRDTEVQMVCGATLDVQNPSLNSHTMTIKSGSDGTLKVGSTVTIPTYLDTTYTDELPGSDVTISAYHRYYINGVRGAITVYKNGILGGTGTVGAVTLNEGGILAPGMSPGCLTSGNLSLDAGIYRAELGSTVACTGYDQMKVTGTVTLTNNPTLDVSRYNSFKPKAGDTFTVISNDGTDAVSGTFKNLAEGATFKVDGYVLKVSYVGGDGNDVVVTVASVPATPNTGFGLMLNNPAATLGTAVLAAGALLIMSRRLKPATKRARR